MWITLEILRLNVPSQLIPLIAKCGGIQRNATGEMLRKEAEKKQWLWCQSMLWRYNYLKHLQQREESLIEQHPIPIPSRSWPSILLGGADNHGTFILNLSPTSAAIYTTEWKLFTRLP